MATTTGDPYVQNTQKWLNDTFGGKTGYTTIEENGRTGWTTIYALIHALQITLEVGSTADNFGTGTENAFNAFVRANGNIQERTTAQDEALNQSYENATGAEKEALGKLIEQYQKIHGIIQGALLCKGYAIGTNTPTGNFYSGTANAIKNLKEDAGLSDTTSIVTLNIMKALLSMDYFMSYDTSVRTQNIIAMQRYLNGNYEQYFGIRPCDGVYGRRTNQALIYAIQAEEGMSTSVANGNCGPSTKRCLPNIPYSGGYTKNGQTYGVSYNGTTYSNASINKFKILANMALYFNGFGEGVITSNLDTNIINAFQAKYSVPITGNIDYTTWLSLLISCGDTDRNAIACDCATIITNNNIHVLKDNNYQYIARYLSGQIASGASKALSTDELQLLFSNGIRLFPIHQRSANSSSYFTSANAVIDADSASDYADSLNLQFGAIIYFAVDYDATDAEITNLVIPYFEALYSRFMYKNKGKYRVGVYGTRNLCTRVCNAGYACSSFVSDMSTGFSGNLGFAIPDNWALDQFATTTISSNGASIEIDKDGFSGNYLGISKEYSVPENCLESNTTIANSFVLVNRSGVSIPVYETKVHINWPLPQSGTQYGPSGNQIGEIKPNDFYVFFGVEDPEYDNVHKVLFNNGTDVLMGYIQGSANYPASSDTDDNAANYNQRPLYQEPYSCLRYLPETDTYSLESTTQDHVIRIKKPVVYFTSSGNYAGTLNDGDIITISANNYNNVGGSRPWCYRVSKIQFADGTISNTVAYVSVGLEHGSSGSARAWY